MYSPVLGRFESRDPLPLEGEPDILYGDSWVKRNVTMRLNPYTFVENNPANRLDPSGLAPTDGMPLRFWPTQNVLAILNSADSNPDPIVDPMNADCGVITAPAPKKPPKPACETVRREDAVGRDAKGNATGACNQIFKLSKPPVVLYLKQETKNVNGTFTFPDVCYGCIDHSCKQPKGKKKTCGLKEVFIGKDKIFGLFSRICGWNWA